MHADRIHGADMAIDSDPIPELAEMLIDGYSSLSSPAYCTLHLIVAAGLFSSSHCQHH
jgi:hypothetical protein